MDKQVDLGPPPAYANNGFAPELNAPGTQAPPSGYAPPSGPHQSPPPGYAPPSGPPQAPPPGYAPPSGPPQYGFMPQQYGMGYSQQMQAGTNQFGVVTHQVAVVGGPHVVYQQQAVPETLAGAIFATMCCFWLGIFAIMRANESKQAILRNDIPAAHAHAAAARRLSILAIVLGSVAIVIAVIIGIVTSMSRSYMCYGC